MNFSNAKKLKIFAFFAKFKNKNDYTCPKVKIQCYIYKNFEFAENYELNSGSNLNNLLLSHGN